ncbi:uncharacterized protein LOC114338781 isoform X2 [Diabrotica virgifera virgifera]|uniref:Uncharacterized protein n=1 Tax=Diabrotica virgifera virgifera TaxID=50390 RepID=A0ABM5KQ74_DIAVI|nr:uncharacterized protein LOC114338781 isoform X2 [Diabrotica virgifera virgifera]
MASFKFLLFLGIVGYCCAAPAVNWDEVSRKINEIGNKVQTAARGACGFINSIPGGQPSPFNPQGFNTGFRGFQPSYFPQSPGFAAGRGFPQFPAGRGFPQSPGFPSYYPPSYYPNRFPGRAPNSPPASPQTPNSVPPSSSGGIRPNGMPPVPQIPATLPPSLLPSTVAPPDTQTSFEQNDLNVGNVGNEVPAFIPPSTDDNDVTGNLITSRRLRNAFSNKYVNRRK